ncbi:uncharacterized protein LOC142321509 isoform X1 [Lycorma delicatula]|uniref:uncharacterized protein LOC142321509 isoform X1 n=2 Tax=Lycorma delicatula TaxID=130591 RepID=UPI003F51A202
MFHTDCIFLVILVCFVSTITAKNYNLKKNPHHNEKMIPDNYVSTVNSNCSSEASCTSCSTLRLCYPNPTGPGYIDYKTVECNGTTPFCDKDSGSCSSTPTPDCGTKDEFICLHDGTFPDPNNCARYYTCKNLRSYSFECSNNNYYYYYYNQCRPYGCYNFYCSGYNGRKKFYSGSTNVYTYCIGGLPTLVNRCEVNSYLNETSQRCEPYCESEGFLRDENDCTKYYRCNRETYGYKRTQLQCPEGEAYSTYEFRCLPLSQIPSCNPSSASLAITLFDK